MTKSTSDMLASFGLEMLKRAVLLVLYGADIENRYGTLLTPKEIRDRLNLPRLGRIHPHANDLISGVLDYLQKDGHVYYEVGFGWEITNKGRYFIEK